MHFELDEIYWKCRKNVGIDVCMCAFDFIFLILWLSIPDFADILYGRMFI